MTTHTTTANPLLAFVTAWAADHDGDDCPLSALCQAFSQTSMSMNRLLIELELDGTISRPWHRERGEWDVKVRT